MGDGIGFPNIRQKLVAKTFALRGARYQPGDIHKFHGRGNVPLRVYEVGDFPLPWVRDRHNARIGFDGAKREILRIDTRLCERVEQSGFTHVG